MDYKQKYIKYKLKYLNLVGGTNINLREFTLYNLFMMDENIDRILKQSYSAKNYEQIKIIYDTLKKTRDTNIITIRHGENTEIIRILEEIVNQILNLKENLKRLSLPPFNKKNEVIEIILLIDKLNLVITIDDLEIFVSSLMDMLLHISDLIKNLCYYINKDFEDFKEIELQDTIFLSLFFNTFMNDIDDGRNKLIVNFDMFRAIYQGQFILRIQMQIDVLKKLFEKKKKNTTKIDQVIQKYLIISKEIDNFILNLKKNKVVKYINKIKLLLSRCGYTNKTMFEQKFKDFILKFDKLLYAIKAKATALTSKKEDELRAKAEEDEAILKATTEEERKAITTKIFTEKNIVSKVYSIVSDAINSINEATDELQISFLALLDTIKDELPSNNCKEFYGKDDVSKYDFYDLLKKISIVLSYFGINQEQLEVKINEIKPFLSTTDRVSSYIRKLKPTVETIESEEKPEVKIEILIKELNVLIKNCLPSFKFVNNFNTFKDNLDPSNIKQVDINRFDVVWNSVRELKDSYYKCTKDFSKTKFSKEELYEKLEEIGKLLLSNISELAEEIESVKLNVISEAIQPKKSSGNLLKKLFPYNVKPKTIQTSESSPTIVV
jgi:hypothetical protein